MTKGKIEAVLERLGRLGLGGDNVDGVDAKVYKNESKRSARLFESVSSIKDNLILIMTLFQLSQEGRGETMFITGPPWDSPHGN